MMVSEEIATPTLPKVVGTIVLVGILWGSTPYFERLALTQKPNMKTEYFQLWRGLMVACIVAVYTVIKYRKDLPGMHQALTLKNFGFTILVAIMTVIFMLTWLYVVRTRVLSVAVTYSTAIGTAVLINAIIGYCCTFIRTPAFKHMGAQLRPENYVGISFVIIGVVLVGLDLRKLPSSTTSYMRDMWTKTIGGTCPYL